MTSETMMPFAALTTTGDGPKTLSTPLTMDLRALFEESLSFMPSNARNTQSASMRSATTESDTIYGTCGGSGSYSVTFDEISGIFSGSFVYNDFCSEEVEVSGRASFSGRMDLDTGIIDYFSFALSNVTVTEQGQTSSVNGTLECNFQGSVMIVTTDMIVAQGDNDGTVACWLNNYTIQTSGSQTEISGRFYHPVYGYVDFETTSPLITYDGDQYPSSGQILFTGAEGTGGLPTTARLTALSSTTCQLTADTDGDGTVNYDTGEIYWSQL